MAANTNKRIPIKHIRDGAKARYPTKIECAICGTTEKLELHHYSALTNLLESWQKKHGISLETDEDVLAIRDRFIAEHEYELYSAVVTLCAPHHTKLHDIYGKSPLLTSATKQERWVILQKEKLNGLQHSESQELVSKSKSSTACNSYGSGVFGSFYRNYDGFSSFRKD